MPCPEILRMRRRRALYRATHRGSKEMDFLLGRFAEQTLDGMNASRDRRVRAADRGARSGDRELRAGRLLARARPDLDELMRACRRFHGLEPG